jgi:hypothetical protein
VPLARAFIKTCVAAMPVDNASSRQGGAQLPQRSQLGELLSRVASEGWSGDAGRQAIGIMQAACRREAAEWTRTAGWLTDEGLSVVWEQMDRLVRAGRFADAPGLLRIAARRAYAAEAAAAQTGVGSVTSRGLIGAVRRADLHAVSPLVDASVVAGPEAAQEPEAPAWMRTLATVLAMEGWTWPVPPLHAVIASAAGATSTSRRSRSAIAAHETGVPAATWSALELLTLGSGPGCRPEARMVGIAVQIDLAGADGVRGNRDLMRVVRAAVQGRSVRTGRRRAA